MSLFENITVGKYSGLDSRVDRLDPRAKIVCVLTLAIAVFFLKNFYGFMLSGVLILAVVLAAGLPLKAVLKGLKPLAWIMIISFVLLMFYDGLRVSGESVRRAAFITARMIFIVLSASLLTLTTSPSKLEKGLESIMSPLKTAGVPAGKLSFMVAMTLRFVPVVCVEADRIAEAQRMRGASFVRGSIPKRIKSIFSIFFPLLAGCLRRASEVNDVLVSRGFDPEAQRSSLYALSWSRADTAAVFLILWVCVAAVML